MIIARYILGSTKNGGRRRAYSRAGVLIALACISLVGLGGAYLAYRTGNEPASSRRREVPAAQVPVSGADGVAPVGRQQFPIEVPSQGYVGSDACIDCHSDSHASWYSTYHRTMTQPATPETVLGSFDGDLTVDGAHYRMERVGDEFWVEMDDPDILAQRGQRVRTRRKIVMVTGSHHMQVCWYSTGKSRILGKCRWPMWLNRSVGYRERLPFLSHPRNTRHQKRPAGTLLATAVTQRTHGRGLSILS